VLFGRFLKTISDALPPSLVLNLEALEALDPDKIYVENVRSILRVSHGLALRICELAVRQGLFSKFVAVQCPDGSEAAHASAEDGLPPTVICNKEDDDGFFHEVTLPTNTLPKVTFYRLVAG